MVVKPEPAKGLTQERPAGGPVDRPSCASDPHAPHRCYPVGTRLRVVGGIGVVTVVGAGWLGTALASALGTRAVARRDFMTKSIVPDSTVLIGSGRSALVREESLSESLASESLHLLDVLAACERARSTRVVVLGSSEVAGSAPLLTGQWRHALNTLYGPIKTPLEDESVSVRPGGLSVTSVCIVLVHGHGRARAAAILRLARQPLIPMPGGGRHFIGSIFLDDAVGALRRFGSRQTPTVVSVGSGNTPMRSVMECLAHARNRRPHCLNVPLPAALARRMAALPLPDSIGWLLRLASPRAVEMEADVSLTPLPDIAKRLVESC